VYRVSAAVAILFSAMRVLITGAAGMLGRDLAGVSADARHAVVALPRAELDITDPAAVQSAVRDARPDVVFNCAAFTNVDGCETDLGSAFSVNGDGAGNLARACATAGAWIVHVSSDYVFDGTKLEPYLESDVPGPLSQYGRSKLAGEAAVAAAAPDGHTIVRSSWLFGTGGPCFPATILRLAAERDELSVVEDQVGCPTFTGHLANALLSLADRRPLGIVHVAAAGQCSWYEFAGAIVEAGGLACEVRPSRTADLERPAPRPAYSVLRSERAETPTLPDWREGLAAFMAAGVTVG
jgi:dTDP-4-dehydrorhamnose reductase